MSEVWWKKETNILNFALSEAIKMLKNISSSGKFSWKKNKQLEFRVKWGHALKRKYFGDHISNFPTSLTSLFLPLILLYLCILFIGQNASRRWLRN